MTKTLLYGGTFDPPHISHVQLPLAAMHALGFDRVLYVPAFQSPLKNTPHSAPKHRLEMLQLALTGCPWAEISTQELDKGGTSYSIDTIESFCHEQHEGDELRLLIGADQWAQFQQWHRWEDIIRLANPAIIPRAGFDIQDPRILQIDTLPGVSTDIRSLIQTNKPIDTLVSPEVAQYIAQHQLYS
jgi:nicotinate-nucleotide adenylyltransferase